MGLFKLLLFFTLTSSSFGGLCENFSVAPLTLIDKYDVTEFIYDEYPRSDEFMYWFQNVFEPAVQDMPEVYAQAVDGYSGPMLPTVPGKSECKGTTRQVLGLFHKRYSKDDLGKDDLCLVVEPYVQSVYSKDCEQKMNCCGESTRCEASGFDNRQIAMYCAPFPYVDIPEPASVNETEVHVDYLGYRWFSGDFPTCCSCRKCEYVKNLDKCT